MPGERLHQIKSSLWIFLFPGASNFSSVHISRSKLNYFVFRFSTKILNENSVSILPELCLIGMLAWWCHSRPERYKEAASHVMTMLSSHQFCLIVAAVILQCAASVHLFLVERDLLLLLMCLMIQQEVRTRKGEIYFCALA